MNQTYVYKHRQQRSELFDPVKLHQSIIAACLAARAYEGEAHATAERVCKAVLDWLATKTEVTSADIRRIAATQLARFHTEAAYMYKHHRVMI